MPLLMCPNDSSAMQTMERAGVQFDMCPNCRGVWLDRGELEKLMEVATADGRASASTPAQPAYAPPPQQASQPWGGGSGHRDDRRDDDRYRHEDRGHYKKKKRDSIFDIFD
jgi:Zn-finger nucleic acid-binding protein